MTRDTTTVKQRDNRGFTILELMVVLAIFCVLGAAAAAGMSHATRINAQQATEYILYDIRHARTEAVKREEVATITFNPANHSYTYTISNTAIAKTVFLRERWKDEVFLLPGSPGGGDPPPVFAFSYSPRGFVTGAAGILYITDREGFTNNVGKVYRIQASAVGLLETQRRDFAGPVWADYR